MKPFLPVGLLAEPFLPVGLLAVALVMLAAAARPAWALRPDEIVLICNARVDGSRALAEFYAQQRQVPAAHILSLDLPFPEEELSPEAYDAQVVPRVREFLTNGNLRPKIKCLVTFWGVPLRVRGRVNTPAETEEVAARDAEAAASLKAAAEAVVAMEALAKDLAPGLRARRPGATAEELARAAAATKAAGAAIAAQADPARCDPAFAKLIDLVGRLAGPRGAIQEASTPELKSVYPQSVDADAAAKVRADLAAAQRDLARLGSMPADRKTRDAMLGVVKSNFGLLQYHQAVQAARQSIDQKETEASLDSELSWLWVDGYPKSRWMVNALHHAASAPRGREVPALMVARIDAPTLAGARRIVVDSLKAEAQGLAGVVALDARGNHGTDPYGRYDESIRNLAALLKAKTKLDVRLDDADAIFPPDSLEDVALYCGWYSLRKYVPSFRFATGAVGFHVASSELVSLRRPGESGWVANLLNDGVVASLGPVAEPYLHSFPRADEFFPLLMTGKLTLAEAYWKTNPLASWMNTCIGDPLYRPFAKAPPLKVEDLPPALRKAVEATPRPGGAVTPAAPPAPSPAPR